MKYKVGQDCLFKKEVESGLNDQLKAEVPDRAWGILEGPNRYRIEPMANRIINNFADKLYNYLKKAKKDAEW